jgi:hypothetical protein
MAKRCVFFAIMAVILAATSNGARACAMCYGKSDSPLAKGMNWGIASLLVVVVGVLSGVATFGIFLARRAAAAPPPPMPNDYVPPTNKA